MLKKILTTAALSISLLWAASASATNQSIVADFPNIRTKVLMKVWRGPNNDCDIWLEYQNPDGTAAIAPRWEFSVRHGSTINVAVPYSPKKEERRYTCINGTIASW